MPGYVLLMCESHTFIENLVICRIKPNGEVTAIKLMRNFELWERILLKDKCRRTEMDDRIVSLSFVMLHLTVVVEWVAHT